MIRTLIPIILVWVSIGIGQTMGIAGAAAVGGQAKAFSKSVGRKVGTSWNIDAGKRRWDAYSKEREKRGNEKFAAGNIGASLGGRVNTRLDKISASRTGQGSLLQEGMLNKETAAARQARARILQNEKKKVDEKAKEYGVDTNMTDDKLKTLHQKARDDKDKTLLAVTSREVAKRKGSAGAVTAADMNAVDAQFKETAGLRNTVAEETRAEVAKSNPEAAYTDATGHLDEPRLREAVQKGTIDASKVAATGMTANFVRLATAEGKLNEKLIEEYQKANPEVDMSKIVSGAIDGTNAALLAHTNAGPPTDPVKLAEYDRKTKQLEKSQLELNRSHVRQAGSFYVKAGNPPMSDAQKMEILKKADHETLAKMADKNPTEFASTAVLLSQAAGAGKTAAVLARMSEEGKDIKGATKAIVDASNAFALPGSSQDVAQKAADSAVKRMRGDYRFDGIV